MCGIAGIYNLDSGPAPAGQELVAMVEMLHPRGPDGSGYLLRPRIGLGHARLSIIDPAGGKQPIGNEDASVWTICNGEIFNYLELRADLERRGHRFQTDSDTEVIVHLYEEHGEAFVEHLNGQFAIALWDERQRTLLLVRDRAGILPLFYCQSRGRLLFASEIKALLPVLGEAPALNPRALDQLFTFWTPVAPETVFEGILEVEPGQLLRVRDGRLERKTYWSWAYPPHAELDRRSSGMLADELHDLLLDAVRLRLRADVPVAAYLSGGLDSSALVALMHRLTGAAPRTFSIGFDQPGLDESVAQRLMIEHVGTAHSSLSCRTGEVAERFIETVWRAETPMLRTAPVPMAMLSGLVREHGYRVVLTGEGADEVLGGYDLFKEAKLREFWARRPDSSWRPALLRRLYPYLELTRQQGDAYLRSFFGIGLDDPASVFFSHLPRWQTTARCKEFFAESLRDRLRESAHDRLRAALPAAMPRWGVLQRAQYLEARLLMPGYLLSAQGDRMLMANSVEGRFPYLDHRLIEFANRLPPALKIRALNEKYLLKQAVRPYLPAAILRRPKQPYRAPDIPAFFDGTPPAYVGDLLSPAELRRSGYFDPARVNRLLAKIRAGRAIGHKDNMALVGILSTQIWHHLFVDNYHTNFRAWRNNDNQHQSALGA